MSNIFKKILWPSTGERIDSKRLIPKDFFKRPTDREKNKQLANKLGKKTLKEFVKLYGVYFIICTLYYFLKDKIYVLKIIDNKIGKEVATIIFLIIFLVFTYIGFVKSNKE